MKAGRVHALIAAGTAESPATCALGREPDLLSSFGVDPDECDLNALWKFRRPHGKVRHNGLRADLH